jgi:hypothetical protein
MCNTDCEIQRTYDEMMHVFEIIDDLLKKAESLAKQREKLENRAKELSDNDPTKRELLKIITLFDNRISIILTGKA